jgi:hypothetical protein
MFLLTWNTRQRTDLQTVEMVSAGARIEITVTARRLRSLQQTHADQ